MIDKSDGKGRRWSWVIGLPFGYVLCGSLSAIALYYLTTETVMLTEFGVGQWGAIGALAGYGVERYKNRRLPMMASLSVTALVSIAYVALALWMDWGRR
jgi:hypothetical protein